MIPNWNSRAAWAACTWPKLTLLKFVTGSKKFAWLSRLNTSASGAPAGVPKDILERLNAALNQALQDATVRTRLEEIGAVPIGLDLDKARTFLADEVVKYRDIITKAGIARIE